MASSNPSVRSNPSLGNGRNGRGAENPHPPNRSAEAPTKKPYAAWAAMMEAAPDEEAGLALPEGERILEVTLISAQGLKPPSGLRRRLLQAYAVAWVDAARRLQTRPDRAGGVDPEWHERLLFRVHEAALADDSRAAVTVEIYAAPAGGWHIGGDSLVGSARFLLGDHGLLSRPVGSPSMFAVGVRRPSGRVHGLLNVAASLVAAPPSPAAAHALRSSPAVSLSGLSTAPIPAGRVLRVLNRSFPTPPPSPTVLTTKKQQIAAKPNKKCADKLDVAVKLNNGADDRSDEEREELREMGGVVFCGPCILPLPRKIHISPSDENLQAFASIFSGGVGITRQSPRH
nr:uncharacterized protein LOC4327168 [Oryza sativa Japonica Group]